MGTRSKKRVEGALNSFLPPAQSKTEAETNVQPVTQTQPQSRKEVEPQAKAHSETETLTQASTQTFTQANQEADVFANVKQALGKEKSTLESQRRRQTFWLSEEDITALDQVHKATGLPKYQIVSEAIQAVHKHVLGRSD